MNSFHFIDRHKNPKGKLLWDRGLFTKALAATATFCLLVALGGPFLFYQNSLSELRGRCGMVGLKCENRVATGEFSGIWPYASAVYELEDDLPIEMATSALTGTLEIGASAFQKQQFEVDSNWQATSDTNAVAAFASYLDICFTAKARSIAQRLASEDGNFIRRAARGAGRKDGVVCWVLSPREKMVAIGEDHD